MNTYLIEASYIIDIKFPRKKNTMKLSIVRNGYNCYYYSNVRKRYVNKFFLDRIAMFDFGVAQPELYIEFFDVDLREYAETHKHPILTRKSLIFA